MRRLFEFCRNAMHSRLGIFLAAINVCLVVSNKISAQASGFQGGNIYPHTYARNCFGTGEADFTLSEFSYHPLPFDILWSLLNLPALLATKIFNNISETLFPEIFVYAGQTIENWTVLLFVTVQWLFIGCLIGSVAKKNFNTI